MKKLVIIHRIIVLGIVFILPINSSGQTNFQRWQFGLTISPDYAYRSLHADQENEGSSFSINLMDGIEEGKLGFTAGLNAVCNFSELFSLETGLLYSNKGYQIKDIIITDFDGDVLGHGKVVNSYNYIDIPLKINLTLLKWNKIRVLTSAGVAANLFLDYNKSFIRGSDNWSEDIYDNDLIIKNKINISPMIGVGVEYRINEKMSLRALPTVRYSIGESSEMPVYTVDYDTSTAYKAVIGKNLWNVGVEFGFFYGINR